MTELVRLSSLIFNRVHWIEPVTAQVILSALDGRVGDLKMSRFEGEQVFSRQGRWQGYAITAGGVAVVPVVGEMVNRGAYLGASSGLVSYEGIRQQLKNAVSDNAVRAIVLDIDSPGGMVAGGAETAALVREVAQAKPVVACANSDMCSAAYALASGASTIVATHSSRVGSIGVVFIHANHERALDKKGIDVTIFQGGKHKTDAHPFGSLSADVAADIQKNIDAHYDAFVKLVVAGRPKLSEQQVRDTEARVYRGPEAVAIGLADRVGTFEDAVALAESMQLQARSRVPAPSTQPQAKAAFRGVLKMSNPNDEAAPVSGYEGMTVSQVEQAVQSLRSTLGITEPLAQASEEPAAPTPAPAPAAQSPTETTDQAADRGRSEEKARVKAIIALTEAKERPLAALALAIETDVPSESASAVLAKMPVEARGSSGRDFYAAVTAAGGSPAVSHMTPVAEAGHSSSLVASAREMAAKMKPPARMQMPTRAGA